MNFDIHFKNAANIIKWFNYDLQLISTEESQYVQIILRDITEHLERQLKFDDFIMDFSNIKAYAMFRYEEITSQLEIIKKLFLKFEIRL